jgi:hypothetical protein
VTSVLSLGFATEATEDFILVVARILSRLRVKQVYNNLAKFEKAGRVRLRANGKASEFCTIVVLSESGQL